MAKTGPLTRDELMLVWAAATDKSYRNPLLDAGDGNGLEVFSQAAEQLSRVSVAIDVTTQALYILPHSGQTNDPASGEQRATVTLGVKRTKLVEHPLYLAAGSFIVEEETTDFGPTGPVIVHPGRKYITTTDLVFSPGETGPYPVEAIAEFPGWSYNNPLPDTISRPVQVGSGFTRDRGTVVAPDFVNASAPAPAKGQIKTVNEADTFVPEHVGQYVFFVAGANAGKVVRVLFFSAAPDPAAQVGSIVDFDIIHAVRGTTFAGTFEDGETVTFGASGVGFVLVTRDVAGVRRLTFRFVAGSTVAIGNTLTGAATGATLVVDGVLDAPAYVAEAPSGGVGGMTWRVLDWVNDWGLEITHDESPTGGKLGILDALGDERDVRRAPGEVDDNYRVRVATLADVVSPNALMRALSRSMGSIPWFFREAGQASLPGFFFDGTLEAPVVATGRAACDAYDNPVFIFTGFAGTTPFYFQERAVVDDADENIVAEGYVGDITNPGTALQELTFIWREGARPFAGGTYRVRGVDSGAVFYTVGVTVPATNNTRRLRRYFDYEQFRGYFIAEVASLGVGEFGFAYDAGLSNAYDASPSNAFYDGFPVGSSNIYRRVYQSLDQARAGGVGFHLERTPPTLTPAVSATAPLVPALLFGSDLFRWYYETYAAGAWRDETAHFDTVQATVGQQPTASTLPNGRFALSFDGGDGLQASVDTSLSVLGAGTSGSLIWAIIQASAIPDFVAFVTQKFSAVQATGFNLGGSFDTGVNGRIGMTPRLVLNYSATNYADNVPHVAIAVGRYDAPDPYVKLYVDGVAIGEVSFFPGYGVPNGPLSIGASMQTGTLALARQFTGKISNVGMMLRTPTDAELTALTRYLRWYGGTP